jgi:hypothetical protein
MEEHNLPACGNEFLIMMFWWKNKKFWGKLIAHFPWYYIHCVENDMSNSSSVVACICIAAVMLWSDHCLAMIEDTQTDRRNLLNMLLRWTEVLWYMYQLSERLVRKSKVNLNGYTYMKMAWESHKSLSVLQTKKKGVKTDCATNSL